MSVEVIYVLAAIPAAVYGWSFIKALVRQDNKAGAWFVGVLILMSLGMPLHRLWSAP